MRRTPHINRLLILRNDRLGDLILTLPAINYARQMFPQSTITALVADRTAPLLHANRDLDQVLTDDGRSTAWELGRRLRAYQFDAVAVINANTRNSLAVWLAGIPLRVTWAYKPLSWLMGNRTVRLRRSHPPVHESDFALAFLKRLRHDPSISPEAPPLHIPEQTIASVRALLAADLGTGRPWFGVHPGSSNSAYNWPPERYAKLIDRLTDHGAVAVTGGPGEELLLAGIHRHLSPRSRSRVACYPHFSLLELAAAIASFEVLTVSNIGPMHLAGLVGTPLVALFSSHLVQSPKKWEPLGQKKTILQATWRGGRVTRDAAEHMCQISVESVLEANLRYRDEARLKSARSSA